VFKKDCLHFHPTLNGNQNLGILSENRLKGVKHSPNVKPMKYFEVIVCIKIKSDQIVKIGEIEIAEQKILY
jgi:hypothetical protein